MKKWPVSLGIAAAWLIPRPAAIPEASIPSLDVDTASGATLSSNTI